MYYRRDLDALSHNSVAMLWLVYSSLSAAKFFTIKRLQPITQNKDLQAIMHEAHKRTRQTIEDNQLPAISPAYFPTKMAPFRGNIGKFDTLE